MVIKIPADPYAGRDPERDARTVAAAGRDARFTEVEKRISELQSLVSSAATAPAGKTYYEKAIALVGMEPEPGNAEMARAELAEFLDERRVLRQARELDALWLRDRNNRLAIQVAEELKPQFAAVATAWIEAAIEAARRETLLNEAYEKLAAVGAGAFISRLTYGGNNPANHESNICVLIRKAVTHGLLDPKNRSLVGVNWQ